MDNLTLKKNDEFNTVPSNLLCKCPENYKSTKFKRISGVTTAQQKALKKILTIISQSEKYELISINKDVDNTIAIRIRKEC